MLGTGDLRVRESRFFSRGVFESIPLDAAQITAPTIMNPKETIPSCKMIRMWRHALMSAAAVCRDPRRNRRSAIRLSVKIVPHVDRRAIRVMPVVQRNRSANRPAAPKFAIRAT
ncbi:MULTISPECIES: hypothetical protein [unclassified Streptomyces]|uniref:hypothetical protein n=1 Tax=unclassified Streptomyces TaxID=2593676 RepID=UPI00115FA505|nr:MULTISPECIES: hypothetical protein [unclassified Streptomyces]